MIILPLVTFAHKTVDYEAAFASGCWKSTFENIKSLYGNSATKWMQTPPSKQIPCQAFTDFDRKAIALFQTDCHLMDRGGLGCNLRGVSLELSFPDRVDACIRNMSPDLVVTYVAQKNHFGTVSLATDLSIETTCYQIHEILWQQRTNELINHLSVAAGDMADKLDSANDQNTRLLEIQRESLGLQVVLMTDSKNIQYALEEGHSALQTAFGAIRNEVQEEHQKVQEIFSDIFSAFHRVTKFQRFIQNTIFDLQTLIVYGFLVFLTHYLTGTKRTCGCRAELYILWTAMALSEVGLMRSAGIVYELLAVKAWPAFRILLEFGWRTTYLLGLANNEDWTRLSECELMRDFFLFAEDRDTLGKFLVEILRIVCGTSGVVIFVWTYFTYNDPESERILALNRNLDRLNVGTRIASQSAQTQLNPKIEDPLETLLLGKEKQQLKEFARQSYAELLSQQESTVLYRLQDESADAFCKKGVWI